MVSYKLLSIDETGKASYQHGSELFILSGVIIPEKIKEKITNRMGRLKKNYFGDDETIFHSRDMSRKKGPFAVLQNKKLEVNFWSSFVSILDNPLINLFFVVADKKETLRKSWLPQTILKRSYIKILELFAKQLKISKSCGKIILESDPYQDFYLIQAHNRLQSSGSDDKQFSGYEYRKLITSLSLVSKLNHDIDVQIADALAPIAGMKYNVEKMNKKISMNTMERMKKRLIDRKLADKENPSFFHILV